MSNPITTNYKISTGEDLSQIFQPLSTNQAQITGYNINNVNDLINLFEATLYNPTSYTITNFLVSNYKPIWSGSGIGTYDLGQIFKKLQTEFSNTSGLLEYPATGTLASNFYLPDSYSYFNFVIYGAGGDGNSPKDGNTAYGGGGAGAYIKALSIPYNNVGNTINTITYNVGLGTSNSYIVVTYDNGSVINLQAGSGNRTVNNQEEGSAGGTCTINNSTTFYDSNNSSNITAINGTAGGSKNNNGTSNGFTSSGSGNAGGDSAPVGKPPLVSNTYNVPSTTYIITSQGGGKDQVVAGYGAGGAATPANYNGNATAYRTGKPGCILYYLS